MVNTANNFIIEAKANRYVLDNKLYMYEIDDGSEINDIVLLRGTPPETFKKILREYRALAKESKVGEVDANGFVEVENPDCTSGLFAYLDKLDKEGHVVWENYYHTLINYDEDAAGE